METIYFTYNKETVGFENLREAKYKDGKEVYDEVLLTQLESGNLKFLNNIDLAYRNNEFFMEPLLYAVKNSSEYGYGIYEFYGDELKRRDLTMATEIVVNEPKVLKGTVITKTDTIVLYLVQYNPEIILYISDKLKNDGEFIEELCKTGNKEAIAYAIEKDNALKVLKNNPDLANNPEFMREAIKEDASVLAHAPKELKDNHEFMKQACKENKEVITYVVEHTEEFGTEGLNAAKEVVVEDTTCRAIDEMQEELEKVQAEKAEMESQEGFDKDSKEYKEIKIRERQLSNNIRFIDKIRNGEVKQERAIRLIDSISKDMDEDYKQELLKYVKLDDAVLEKQKEEKDTAKIMPGQIEKATTENSRISGINDTTRGIRDDREEEIEAEKGSKIEQPTRENDEVGE